ncbi:MAG: S8 family peptidase [Candidatus Aureabacteria bacterium]|nr:S8 family peptidase [Candidatus Auribacterota bacterium]
MKRKFIVCILNVCLIAGALFAFCISEAYPGSKRVIVVFHPSSTPKERRGIVLKNGATIIRELSIVPSVVIHLPAVASEKARQAILSSAPVITIADDLLVYALKKPAGTGKPPKEPPQESQEVPWGVKRIYADKIWDKITGKYVKVAVLDTGIDTDHPDLIDNLNFGGGTNIIKPARSYDDDNGHGTHVAGIIAAVNNDIGVVGVAPDVSLYGVKVLNRNGSGWLSDIMAGLEWCINNQIDVVNMSLGTDYNEPLFQDAVKKVYEEGIVQVAAAGNDGGDVDYPAAYDEVIAVSAVDSGDDRASWSSYGKEVLLAAPGVSIKSTYKGGGYKVLSGTSMASPHVAGCAALILEKNPYLTPDAVRDFLDENAEPVLPEGLVDAEAATGAVPGN